MRHIYTGNRVMLFWVNTWCCCTPVLMLYFPRYFLRDSFRSTNWLCSDFLFLGHHPTALSPTKCSMDQTNSLLHTQVDLLYTCMDTYRSASTYVLTKTLAFRVCCIVNRENYIFVQWTLYPRAFLTVHTKRFTCMYLCMYIHEHTLHAFLVSWTYHYAVLSLL